MVKNNIIVKVSIDYGAEEYIWISSFIEIQDLLNWYQSIENIDLLGEKLLEWMKINKELFLIKNFTNTP